MALLPVRKHNEASIGVIISKEDTLLFLDTLEDVVHPQKSALWLTLNPRKHCILVNLGCLCDHPAILARVLGDVLCEWEKEGGDGPG